VDATIELGWHRLCKKLSSAGYEQLSPAERVWINTRSFIDSVENGGSISYFYNSGADRVDDCRSALKALGATAELQELERACSLFGARVPTNIEERNEIISSWDDEGHETRTLDSVDDALMPMMDSVNSRLTLFVKTNFPAT
jgi:hypothetical protein